jgi:endogenous inhibitor of DNA gyrase (YacG/DUF329 family)
MNVECPNCGRLLEDFRTDRQKVGKRQIVLSWMICKRCGHIGLKGWSYAEPESLTTPAHKVGSERR